MKKVLFITDTSFRSISDLLFYLQEYTINNGTLPSEIQMTEEAREKYQQLLNPKIKYKKLYFRGIGITVS